MSAHQSPKTKGPLSERAFAATSGGLPPKRVLIVGAGISGLSAAYSLRKAGWDPFLIDSRPRAGGVLETTTVENCLIEGGPDSYLAQKPWASSLIAELGMADDLIGSNDDRRKTFIVRRDKLVPMPDGLMMMVPTKVLPMLRTPLLGWPTKLRMGLDLFRRKPRDVRDGDISVADFFRDHYGQEAVDYLAEPLLAGVYGGDPARMSANCVLSRFVELERKYGSLSRGVLKERRRAKPGQASPLFRTLKNGMGSLSDKLVDVIGKEHFHLGSAAEVLERTADGYSVRVSGERIQARNVILATPAYGAGALLGGLAPEAATLLREIPYNSSATVALIFDAASFARPLDGFGFLVPRLERKTLVATTYVQNKFSFRVPDNKVLLRCFVGNAAEEDPQLRDDQKLFDAVRSDLKRLIGLDHAPLAYRIFRWNRAMAQYEIGHTRRIDEILERTEKLPGIHLAGNAYEGIGIPDCVRSGQKAAAACIARDAN